MSLSECYRIMRFIQSWNPSRCRRYVKFAGASTTSLVAGIPLVTPFSFLANERVFSRRMLAIDFYHPLCPFKAFKPVVMILRVYALYLGNKYILTFLLTVLSGQVIVSGWAVHNGMREYMNLLMQFSRSSSF